MGANTKIQWATHSFNPFIGCTKISEACTNCYAEKWGARFGVKWGPGQLRKRTSASTWKQPLRWNRKVETDHKMWERFMESHPSAGMFPAPTRPRVFCGSLCDVFDNEVPIAWFVDFLDLCRLTQHLDKLLLTKRIGNAKKRLVDALEYAREVMLNPLLADWIEQWLSGHPPSDVWLGITVCNQEEADRDIPKLLAVPAEKRFLSIEPMLGPVDLVAVKHSASPGYFGDCLEWYHRPHSERYTKWPGIDWVIGGGETGTHARPMHPDWVRSLRDQCQAAGTAFWFKQWGEWLPGQNETHPAYTNSNGTPQIAAHHQDGRWGPTETKLTKQNYVRWDKAGDMHVGPYCIGDSWIDGYAWAERVGHKVAGNMLDGRVWEEVPA